jgi:hypothetical protein
MLRTHSVRVVAHFSSLKAVAKWVFPRARARNPDREDWTMRDSSSRRHSGGTNHYRGKSDSLFAAETQQIEHEQEQDQEHERTA